MFRPFLVKFRCRDARSLAQALALLLVFNACFGAFHAGSMAGASWGGTSLCVGGQAADAGSGAPLLPDRDTNACLCCVLGCISGQAVANVADDDLSSISSDADAIAPPSMVGVFVRPQTTASAGPRGPPLIA